MRLVFGSKDFTNDSPYKWSILQHLSSVAAGNVAFYGDSILLLVDGKVVCIALRCRRVSIESHPKRFRLLA